MILAGLAPESLALCFFSALNILLGAVYTLWLSSRTVLGAWSSHLRGTTDLSFADLFLLLLLSGLTLLLGLFAHRSVQLLTAAG
jgi:NADH:ubiquinone oxidoreductase subunit 4 (subunit M)